MSIQINGISTVKEAWKNAAEEETRPASIPEEYTDNRGLPNIASLLTACSVSIRSGAVYADSQLIKYEDLLVAPRTLQFTVKGQTNTVGTYAYISPAMISSFILNDNQLTSQELTAAYQGDGVYKFDNYQNTKVKLVIDASNASESIVYKQYSEDSTFKSFNEKVILLRNINSHPLTELKYTWAVTGRDIDLNFFVIKNTDGVHSLVGMFGFNQAVSASSLTYYPVPIATGTNTFPTSGCDFCLSLDIDDQGSDGCTEILSIYPVDMTWAELMENYDFVYAAIDYGSQGDSMGNMTAKLSSDDFEVTKEMHLETSQSEVNAWMICRFGSTTNGQIVEYKNDSNESLTYTTNNVTVPASVTQVGIDLEIKTGSQWN